MRMTWVHVYIAAMTLLFVGCRATAPEQKQAPSQAGAKLFAEYYEERLKLYPVEATYAGDDRYNDQLPNPITEEFRAREKAFFEKYQTAVRKLDRKKLSAEDQLSCDILSWECETQLERLRFPGHLMPIDQFNGLHLAIGQWAGGTSAQPFRRCGITRTG